jgi:glucose-1-phosphate thymidylyltransferase
MKSLILAGGFATRLYPLTLNRAKALLEYRGKPVISHIIEKIPLHIKIMISTNKKFETDFLRWQKDIDRQVEVLVEDAVTEGEKKGAIGAIEYWVRSKNIQDDLLVIAADNYFDFDFKDLLDRYNGRNPLIAVYDVGDKEKACEIGKACQVGLVVLQENKIVRFDEKPQKPTSSIIATGMYILPRRIFPLLSRYCQDRQRDNLGSFISYLLDKEEVHGYAFRGVWLDIGDEILRGKLEV